MGKRIGLRDIRDLAADQEIFDTDVTGFYARRRKGAAISYGVLYRTAAGRSRRFTIGRHGSPWTPDTARQRARLILGDVARGEDPAGDKQAKRHAITVAELCGQYLEDAEAGRLLTRRGKSKRPLTLLSDRGRIERHIVPLLGRMKVAAVTSADVESFMHAVAEGKTAARTKTSKKRGLSNVRGGSGVASRTVGLLGGIFTYAVRRRLRPDNPVHGVIRPADAERQRRLSDDEFGALGDALRRAEGEQIWPPAVACARFLALTGWRSGEALALRWRDVDLVRRTATLQDTKTGASIRPLSHAACDVLRTQSGIGELVFRAARGAGLMSGFPGHFDRILKLASISGVTPHTLRHSYASCAAEIGFSEPTIAALIGHKSHSITGRYIHAADTALLKAADAVANHIAALMGDVIEAEVVELRRA